MQAGVYNTEFGNIYIFNRVQKSTTNVLVRISASLSSASIARSQPKGIPLTIDHVLGYPSRLVLSFFLFVNVFSLSLPSFIAMASHAFVFDEDDPPPPAAPSADRGSSSFLLSSGELDFDAYVAVSPPVGHTGGVDVDMKDTVDMLNRIETSESKQGLLCKLVRITGHNINSMCKGVIGGSNGLRFCIKTNCRTISHQKKVQLSSDTERYYIGRGSQAHIEPYIPTSWIPQEEETPDWNRKKSHWECGNCFSRRWKPQ